MPYTDHFKLADDLITHLNGVLSGISDPFIESRYVGFVAVSAVTVYELAIREIFCQFSQKKHVVFGHFTETYYDRLNGRIKTDELRNNVKRFGPKYVERYKRNESALEKNYLTVHGISVFSAYNNLIQWRHEFAHQGQIPTTATYAEVIKSYEVGKELIYCLDKTMRL